ncbi:putative gustatory receptor 28a [Ischnura elegans]|uniref:putative gustatory receptor 28a n=1 Tax=Ischnura elegans TaxID=197161 RepID=UPI001ED88EE6|nr:putative gustatory receptor 28a [Ischnura elegans]
MYAAMLGLNKAVSNEASRARDIAISRLFRTKDDALRFELCLLSIQLQQTPLQFSASGFFRIDGSLCNSLSSAAVTHLVILVQFQLANEASKQNLTCT